MIVCVLSLGSYWREPNDGRPVVWNSTGVFDERGLRPRSKVYGQVRIDARLYNEVIGTGRLRGSLWHAPPVSEHLGIRKLALLRRAPRGSHPDSYLVAVTESLVGVLDDASWDSSASTVLSFSAWKGRQEALLLAAPHAWLRGTSGSAILNPDGPDGDWTVRRW